MTFQLCSSIKLSANSYRRPGFGIRPVSCSGSSSVVDMLVLGFKIKVLLGDVRVIGTKLGRESSSPYYSMGKQTTKFWDRTDLGD